MDKQIILAALLHDLLEDTDITFKELSELFSFEVAKLVRSLSREFTPVPVHISEDMNLARMYQNLQLQNKSIQTRIIKCADRIDNLRDMLEIPSDDRKYERIPHWISEAKLSLLPIMRELPSNIYSALEKEIWEVECHFVEETEKLFNYYGRRLQEVVNSSDSVRINIGSSPIELTEITS